jgi:predicted Zn-dependent protease
MANVSAASAVYYGEIRAMLSFYERHAAYARAAEMLRGESARDPIRNGFDYQNQMAVAHRLAGDSGRELEALGAAYKGVSGNLVSGSVDWVGRYFELLHARGLRGELDSLASIKSPYQLQLINFLIEKGERELARKAIANAGQSAAWVASRSGEVGLFLKDTSAETESHFKRALGLRRIGEMLGRNAAAQGDLVGKDWFIASRNYGYWLGLSSDRQTESSNYVLGEIEGQPSSAEGQLELAAYYLDRKDADRASSHVALAAELAPGSNDVTVMRGRVLFARGDRAGAIQTWAGLMSGRPATGDAAAYIKVMADHGLLAEALPRLENYLVAYIARASRSDDETMSEGYKSLVRQIAARARADATLTSQAAALFEAVISRLPADISFGQLVIKENLLPEPAQSSIYRAVHARLSDMVAGLMGTSRVETGIYVGGDYIYPASALEDWRRRLLDYLIRNRSFDEARLLIDTIRQEMAESELALENSSDDSESYNERYQWLPLAAAGVELRAGSDMTKVMAELRGYCHLDGEREISEGYENTQRHDRCLKAYALLAAEGKPEEADALLYDAYRADVESRFINDASLAGLAEIEARRGRSAEATRLLRMLVERSTDNLDALRLAAETSARAGLYADAVEFRQQIAEANPSHAVNRLELARAMAAAGRSAEAIDRIATLMAERATANSVRAQAAEVVGDIVRADRSQAARAANLFSQRAAGEDRGGALARAAIAEAAGDPAGARAALAEVNSGPLAALARMKSGLAALAGGRDSEAIESFEQALYLDADGLITDALAFRAQGPRQQLILLYSKTGRDLAAVRLSESDDPSRPSSLARAVRIAINFQNDPPPSGFAFEPSIIAAREKAGGLRSLAEMNEAAMTKSQDGLLAALVESAARLGQYDRAIAIERARAVGAKL